MNQKPILITGSIRSGTTWLGVMLSKASGTLFVDEPFSLHPQRYSLNELANHWFSYAPAMPQQQTLAAFQRVLDGKEARVFGRKQIQRYLPFTRHKRLIIKDPIACFSMPWLVDNFDLFPIVIVRHPAAFALSLKRVGWSFDFANLWQQPELWQQFPESWRIAMQQQPTDIVQQAILLWNCTYSYLLDACEQHPDWLLLRHEDLSLRPVEQFQDLYQQLDLPWNMHVEQRIINHTNGNLSAQPNQGQVHSLKRNSAASIHRWKQELSSSEIDAITKQTWMTAKRIYSKKDFFV